jgi:hypothetical protein
VCGNISKTLDLTLNPSVTVQLWMNEGDQVCDQLKQIVLEEEDNEEKGLINLIVERLPSYAEIEFVPIIHDLNCHFVNYADDKL